MPTAVASPARSSESPILESALFDSLNDAQLAAATHDGPALRIVAGAGTGKTTALTARCAWLVANGTPAERVLVLSFTRRAARQLVDRTHTALGDVAAGPGRVRGGTFHSVAHRMIREHGVSMGLDRQHSVLDASDAYDTMGLVREDVLGRSATTRRFPRKESLLDMYSRAVNTQQPLADVVAEIAPWCTDEVDRIAEICRAYVERKRAAALLDFDDLLLYLRAAARHPEVGARLASDVDHICVDEYQDVNTLQVDILAGLFGPRAGGSTGITVVGDDSQAVFGFRGSSPQHLLDADSVFQGMSTVVLERNYRSGQPILDLANAVGEEADEGFRVRLVNTDRPQGPRPSLHRCTDEGDQAQVVCAHILEHREEGIALRDQAVLVRAAHHSALLEVELTRRRIPFVKYGGLKFLEAAHVKDLTCLFRLVDNPYDDLAWFRILQRFEGVGPATARRAIACMLDRSDVDADSAAASSVAEPSPEPGSVLDRWPEALVLLPPGVRTAADSLVASLVAFVDETAPAHARRLLDAVTPLVVANYDNAEQRLTDLEVLVDSAPDAATVSDIAAAVTLEPPSSTSDLAGPPTVDDDWLTISTIHSAKGLEWDVVHVLNAADGNIPSDMGLGSAEELEEERRLFYVAVTRPAHHLHLSYPQRFHHRPFGHDDAHTYAQPSRFVSGAARGTCDWVTSPALDRLAVDTAARRTPDLAAGVAAELDALWG